jgi:Mg-chelatase subunit ChlD
MAKPTSARTRATLVGILLVCGIAAALAQTPRPGAKASEAQDAGAIAAAESQTAAAPIPSDQVQTPPAEPAPPDQPAPPAPPPKVEVVFVLDTTGSMDGLINGAKAKIWSIANFIVSAQPTPEVRIGLIAYRDVGDAYVTKVYGLTEDLDKVHQRLRAFKADGGGDTPEHVSRALSEAVDKMQWSDGAMKMIFLVGDAPPAERGDGYSWRSAVKKARAKEIVIHAVRCGSDGNTGRVWNAIATAGFGSYMTIRGDGGVVATRKTPMDKRLAELSAELDDTVVIVGGTRARDAYKAKRAAPMAPSAEADRAGYLGKASGGGAGRSVALDDADGTEELATGRRDVTKLGDDELPAEMKGMDAAQRKAYVAKKAARRKEILAEMHQLGKERDAWLKANTPKPAKTGFDAAVEGAVEKQAEAYGLQY